MDQRRNHTYKLYHSAQKKKSGIKFGIPHWSGQEVGLWILSWP